MRKVLILIFILFIICDIEDSNVKRITICKKNREYRYIKQAKARVYKCFNTKSMYMNRDTVMFYDSINNIIDIYEGTHEHYLYKIKGLVEKNNLKFI